MSTMNQIQQERSLPTDSDKHRIPWAAVERVRAIWIRRALRGGHRREDAEDLFQDALLASLEGLERLRVAPGQSWDDAFLAWFWGILRHKSISHQRRRKRLRKILDERGHSGLDREIRGTSATRVRTSLGLFAQSSPEAAQVLQRRFLEGQQLSELADELGVSVPTACRRVKEALKAIRGCAQLICL